jgi:formate C-acetyltransferase
MPHSIEDAKNYLVGGGGKPYIQYFKDRSFVNVADSLMATNKLVFEDRKITMGQLVDALDSNFEGENEEIRQMCIKAPKFGNDIDEVDYLLKDCARFSTSIGYSEKCAAGDNSYMINRNGVAWHYYAGKGIGALPDGRKALEPLADGSISPMNGRDKNGPTAVMNSVLKADFTDIAVPILNMRLPVGLFKTSKSFDKYIAFTEAFLKNGGIHIQYNILDTGALLEAKKYPEKYKDLVVRVAGYSAYFVNLTPEVQDEIITRTEQWI